MIVATAPAGLEGRAHWLDRLNGGLLPFYMIG